MMFRFWLMLGRCGFFRHEGLRGFQPNWWPQAQVLYPACDICPQPMLSDRMGVGNAVDYAKMFGGEVVPVGYLLDSAQAGEGAAG